MVQTRYSVHTDAPIARVDKTAYIVLALLLGVFGAHRFYSKKVISGIIYLLLFPTGITILLGFLEALIASGAVKDENGEIPVYKNRYFVY